MALGQIEQGLPDREEPQVTLPDLGDTTNQITNAYSGTQAQQEQLAAGATSSTQPSFDIGTTAQQVQQYAPIAEGDSQVSELSTVQGQLSKILNPDSELMMQARARGEVQAARSGQLGSTAGIRASQGALYDRGIEIAARDADTYAQAGRLAQQGRLQQAQTMTEAVSAGTLSQQEAALTERRLALNNAFQTAMKQADQTTAAILQDQQGKWNEAMTQLEQDFNEWSTRYQVSSQMRENMLNRMAEAQLNHQIVTQELLGDPSFLELGGPAISNLMNTMVSGVAASIKSNMVAAGYAATDPGLNDMLDNWVDEMTLIDFSGI